MDYVLPPKKVWSNLGENPDRSQWIWARRRRHLAPTARPQLPWSKNRCGRPYVLGLRVRWTGLDAAGDRWDPLDNLTKCEAAIAACE